MPKKPVRNGYFYFMLDFKQREERLGRRFPNGMKEVTEAASGEWNSLSQNEKEYYNKMAKERKKTDSYTSYTKSAEKKFNCQGISFAQIEREARENERKLAEINTFINNFVNEMSLEDLKNKLLYLIHVNFFCKTDNDEYYPAELAIIKFTLSRGIRDVFHRYIDPGDIKMGYSFEAKEHAETTHKLSLQFVKSIVNANNMPRMYTDVCEFLHMDEKDEVIPPLFTMYDDVFFNTSMTAVKKTLQHLWENSFSHSGNDDSWEKVFKVYPLSPMFAKLKNKCYSHMYQGEDAFPNHILAKNELDKDTYNFQIDTACNFHQAEDAIAYCSKSYVTRWSYIIRDHCCSYIGIDIFGHESFDNARCDENGDADYDDCKSELSNCTTDTKYSEKSVAFPSVSHNIKDEKDFDFSNAKIKKEAEYEFEPSTSVKSCPVVWPHNTRKQETVPELSEDNFPALGFGRGSTKDVRNRMKNLNLQN